MSPGLGAENLHRNWCRRRELGVFAGFLFVCARTSNRLSDGSIELFCCYLVAQPVRTQRSLSARRGRSIEVREAALTQVLRLPVDRPRHLLENRFAQGARCPVARVEGRFVGYLWFVVGEYEENQVMCRFVPLPEGRAAWDFDVFVEPSARLSVAFPRLRDEARCILSSIGVRWSISRISAFNVDSLASCQRLGLARLARAVYLCMGRVQLMVASARPYVHLTWLSASRPVMSLSVR